MEEVWFLENKRWFIKFDKSFTQTVKLNNNTNMVVEGKGSTHMQVNGFTEVIYGVYYVL